jgi:hypothetical protein
MKKIGLIIFVICGLALWASSPTFAKELYIHDFDSGAKPNRVDGDFGAWDKDPTDFSQTCGEIFDSSVTHGDGGFSMRLDYDVDSPNPAYNGFWSKLEGVDASDYNKLVMWVKGDADKGFTKVFKIELKNDAGETGRFYVTNVTDQWSKVEIPLDRVAGLTDFSSLTEFVIVFEDRIATDKEGTIWIDDIYFSD